MTSPPFPHFGGKRKTAELTWKRFGDTPNYIEPFGGALATLLMRPHWSIHKGQFNGKWYRTETVNELNAYITNFWRAVSADAKSVARHAKWPVNELDLHARHRWLVNQTETLERIRNDPHFYDVKVAAWWVWGKSSWIGSGWCKNHQHNQLPELSSAGAGTNAVAHQRPNLRPGQGVNNTQDPLLPKLLRIQKRLERVRVCCGDWGRVLTDSITTRIGLTAVFLDPPYPKSDKREMGIYAHDSDTVAHAVREWAIANGNNPKFRMAYCGYEGQQMPDDWECVAWKTNGGYGNQNKSGNPNARRERMWFSPHCLKPKRAHQTSLLRALA